MKRIATKEEAIDYAADRVREGATYATIVKELDRLGAQTPSGTKWTNGNISYKVVTKYPELRRKSMPTKPVVRTRATQSTDNQELMLKVLKLKKLTDEEKNTIMRALLANS